MKHPVAVVLLALALSMLAGGAQAQAQAAYTSKEVHLRAGPGRDYPVVAILPAGLQIWVEGCVSDYTWCEVVVGENRGWVYAGNIYYYYEYASGYVPLLNYGAAIGIGLSPFFINDYWGRYYYNRPWYAQRDRWAHRPPPARIYPSPRAQPPGQPGYLAPRPQPHSPGRPPQQPHAPQGVPTQPHAPGVVPGRPHGPGTGPHQPGAPIGVPRQPHSSGVPSGTGHPSGPGAPAPEGGRCLLYTSDAADE